MHLRQIIREEAQSLTEWPRRPKPGRLTLVMPELIRNEIERTEIETYHPGYSDPRKALLVKDWETGLRRVGRGYSLDLSPESLDSLLSPTGFFENVLDMIDAGYGSDKPGLARMVRMVQARAKALKSGQGTV